MPNSLPDHNSQIDPKDLLATAKAVLNRGEIIVVINDIDLTISTGGITGEDDPRLTKIYPLSSLALRKIESTGHRVAFISNRGGLQIARMTKDAGIKKPQIIGTYGFETYDSQSNTSLIDDRFIPYRDEINSILTLMETFVLNLIGYKDKLDSLAEFALPYIDSKIVLERKGICSEFPKGLAHIYNLNLIEPSIRTKLVTEIEEKYHAEIKKIMGTHHMLATALMRVWGMNNDRNSPSKPGRYSVKFEPVLKQSKAYGIINLLKNIRNELPSDKRIGLIIYAGDSNQDGEAMKALKQIVKFHNEDYIAHNSIHAFNIWVKPDHDEVEARKQSDMVVEGVEGYAELLSELADITLHHTHPHFPFQFKQIFRI